MKKDRTSEKWEKPKQFELPAYPEIPDVGLYLEQVTKYVSRYILPMHSFSITASMVSNYVKKGLLEKPVKKLYYREQIADVFVIAVAKLVLSLEDIQILLERKKDEKPGQFYTRFCEALYSQFDQVFQRGKRKQEGGLQEKELSEKEQQEKEFPEKELPEKEVSEEADLLEWTAKTVICRMYLETLVNFIKNM